MSALYSCLYYLMSSEERQPYNDGVYMLPTLRAISREGDVFSLNMIEEEVIHAFSIVRSKIDEDSDAVLQE